MTGRVAAPSAGLEQPKMPKYETVDTDYVVFSPFMKAVGAEMGKSMYSVTSKDVPLIKQAEQMGLTAQECANLIIRNRSKRKLAGTKIV